MKGKTDVDLTLSSAEKNQSERMFFSVTFCNLKGKLRYFSTWTLFSHVFVSKAGHTLYDF